MVGFIVVAHASPESERICGSLHKASLNNVVNCLRRI